MLHTPITFPAGQLGGGLPHNLYFNPQPSLLHIEKLRIAVGDFPVNTSQGSQSPKEENQPLFMASNNPTASEASLEDQRS